MKHYRHPILALLLSLLLIGSQQAAFAHLLSHLHSGLGAVTHYQNDHGTIDQLADTCTTCIAFAGAGGNAATSSAAASFTAFTGENYLLPVATAVFTRPVVTSRARAPPAFL
jgi:hypothetical protein